MEDIYLQLAKRNGWDYSLSDGRPYFMKNGKYAIPDETTSEEDKQLLADILSEGSSEMAQLIQLCWDNGIVISGPCSGIREFHDEPPLYLHFSFKASENIINPLFSSLQETFPTFNHMCRKENDLVRYDVEYFLNGKELTIDESDGIFSEMKNQLQNQLENSSTKSSKK